MFAVGIALRFASVDQQKAAVGGNDLRLTERLATVAKFSPDLSPSVRAQLLAIAEAAESDPLRQKVLAGTVPPSEAIEGLPEGYRYIADYQRAPTAQKEQALRGLAVQAMHRLLLCSFLLAGIVGSALAWSFLARTASERETVPMAAASPVRILAVFLSWDVLNLFAVGPLMTPLRALLDPLPSVVVAQAAGYGLLLLLLKWARPNGGAWNLAFPFPLGGVGRGYFVCFALVLTANVLVGALRGEPPASNNPLLGLFMRAGVGEVLALGIMVVLVGPFFEELIFRGWLLGGLRAHWGDTRAIIVSSALFAAIHADLWATPALFLLGCVFGKVYLRSGSLYGSILLHAMWNATTFTFLLANMP